jgi:hypothetical protein
MQSIEVGAFTYDKLSNTMSAFDSDLRGKLDLNPLLNFQSFQVVGRWSTKTYCLFEVDRDRRENEIKAWKFRPINGHGKAVDGPILIIFND